MPSIHIDGREISFEPGETILQVAERSSVEIPYYCWHRKLSTAANCRMCLVEVEKAPKLLPACQTECRDGMTVHTKNDKVRDAQRAVHEFLLINHPIDCPICDQAGECKLQNYYMGYQQTSSRMVEEKVHKPRLERLGPHVLYNGERCILCTRCVRFMEEIAKDRQLGVFHRGDHAHIGIYPGKELDNGYSLNTVDVCPVGALTSSVFRFKQRVWNLERSPSICPGCARGCNIHVDQRSGVVYRLKPRDNDDVNACWMCDEGRLTYTRANENRLTQPLVMRSGAPEEVSAQTALDEAVRLLGPLAESKEGIGVALTLHATCEEAYVFGRLARDLLGVSSVALLEHWPGESDDFLRLADRNPNRAGVARVMKDLGLATVSRVELEDGIGQGQVKALVCLGHEADDCQSLAKAAGKLEVFVHIAHAKTELAEVAHVTLPGVAWVQVDGTWVNDDQRAQRLTSAFAPEGEARPAHEWVGQLADRLGVSFALPSVQTIRAEMTGT
ncbi:2Fe-2S iron-sulfur cluster-binding protein, partial [Myxococcota bacterium]